ncbi:diacylglycerol/lipid kinase family protein [Falsiroseomonas tokyonensis]|uniref:Diacylglycerol/lipid kinase family protein n=1 Tax=Falsiroseomonas tokyonensis TaxID=430521 RepID=A0ABV7BV00_9PROT|nr:diacylglycerol kinase family protein [Falsiroseomonas tokyonensis]MBU8539329.1 diacylglycerol kinase family lipid kinase [Falsiroseomonas tokyonensis]
MLIVFNPTAGAGRRRRLARAMAALAGLGLRPEVAETQGPGDARLIAAAAARHGRAVVVAAGGDGTIAEVAAGLEGSEATLGLLPLGTANVLAWELGLHLAPEAAAGVLARGRPGRIWPGQARFADGRRRLFVQMLGAGFDAAVVAGLDLRLKRRLGRAAYVLQTLAELPRYGFPPIELRLDGQPLQAASVIVSKGRLYAGRYLLAPAARPAEPGFQVVLFQQGGPAAAALAGAALPLGLVSRLPGVTIRHVQRVELGNVAVPAQADGDPAGRLPAWIEDAPAPLRILLP